MAPVEFCIVDHVLSTNITYKVTVNGAVFSKSDQV